ncbi:MAG: acyl carrier protein [Acidobacteria bacterium]|nr:acyl carrier protein [Acidobacteriota bacterium]
MTKKVISTMAATQHISEDKITIDSTFQELGIDSLDGINILFALESAFDISIPDDKAKEIRSVREMVDGVRMLVEAKSDGSTASA